jgi:hypothetical protein
MMDYVTLGNLEIQLIPLLVVLFETVLIGSLLIGWYFGARRLNIDLHHWMVYGVTPIHALIWLLWMFPAVLRSLPGALQNPIPRFIPIIHWTSGLIALILSITIAITFIFNRNIPLGLLRRIRPLMIVTIISWTIAFVLGLYIFINFKIESTPDYYYIIWNLV